jgi:hypothetical protein
MTCCRVRSTHRWGLDVWEADRDLAGGPSPSGRGQVRESDDLVSPLLLSCALDLLPDLRQHCLCALQPVVVPEPQDGIAAAPQIGASLRTLDSTPHVLSPSTSITSFGSSAQKSTTYDPSGCWRRNLTPESCRARRYHQRRRSASLCGRRRVRAVRVEVREVFAGALAIVVEAAPTQINKEGSHLIPSPNLSRGERSTGQTSMATAERPNPRVRSAHRSSRHDDSMQPFRAVRTAHPTHDCAASAPSDAVRGKSARGGTPR